MRYGELEGACGSGKIRCHKIGPRLGNVRLPCNSATAFILATPLPFQNFVL
jgi:hypothetical protein